MVVTARGRQWLVLDLSGCRYRRIKDLERRKRIFRARRSKILRFLFSSFFSLRLSLLETFWRFSWGYESHFNIWNSRYSLDCHWQQRSRGHISWKRRNKWKSTRRVHTEQHLMPHYRTIYFQNAYSYIFIVVNNLGFYWVANTQRPRGSFELLSLPFERPRSRVVRFIRIHFCCHFSLFSLSLLCVSP